MAEVYDILLDESMDIQIASGDLVVGESTRQHQQLLMLTAPGQWKASPLVGVDVRNYMHDESPADMVRETKRQLIADGMTVDKCEISQNELIIEAAY